MKIIQLFPLTILMASLLASCASPASSPTTAESSPEETAKSAPESSNLPTDGTPVSNLSLVDNPPTAAVKAAEDLSRQLGVPVSEISFLKIEQVDWPDGCLGVHQPDQMCVQMITPGYQVILEVEGQQYEYHTNLDGSYVVPATTIRTSGTKP